MKKHYLRLYFWVVLIAVGLCSCVDPYEFDFEKDGKHLVVEGFLNDNQVAPDTIQVYFSNYSNNYSQILDADITKASILIEDTQQQIPLLIPQAGKLIPPKNFVFNPNYAYRLKFELSTGDKYQSTAEKITPTPPILKVKKQFNLQSKLSTDGKNYISASELFVDFQDDPKVTNFYLWRYTHYEKLAFCKTCNNSVLDYGSQQCGPAPRALQNRMYFDYPCESSCFAILHSPTVIVQDDRASQGKLIQDKLVAQIPYYNDYGCLVDLEQISVSLEVYKFNQLVRQLSQGTGGLADTPPSAIIGNIQNLTNPDEKVVGYFGVANIQKRSYWLDRTDASGPMALILGHTISEEPSNPPTRPPSAKCVQSATRTPFQPKGWQ
ncbi:DUF4249 domain-containing protein [Flectobacillus sp. DC10W]|uniref:DUF4249 domain-containing protein n=1 Tax=Flectobacillus longus TaxID=2984207 RepID=A0ABT6YNK7_9BACT|nr:DUF4249 domain-containing protein [Flectobacillus longus]MDI9865169.1 DUF4249 domain-containing protein [Flectobacillus longus]